MTRYQDRFTGEIVETLSTTLTTTTLLYPGDTTKVTSNEALGIHYEQLDLHAFPVPGGYDLYREGYAAELREAEGGGWLAREVGGTQARYHSLAAACQGVVQLLDLDPRNSGVVFPVGR
jgi:hypothetical protein